MNYKKFLNEIKLKLKEKEFENTLQELINIDQKYYLKTISPDELLEIVNEYEEQEEKTNAISKCQILTIGNPEIIFRLGIEAVRNNLKKVFISVNDFCLAQNKFIVAFFNKIFKENNILSISYL